MNIEDDLRNEIRALTTQLDLEQALRKRMQRERDRLMDEVVAAELAFVSQGEYTKLLRAYKEKNTKMVAHINEALSMIGSAALTAPMPIEMQEAVESLKKAIYFGVIVDGKR